MITCVFTFKIVKYVFNLMYYELPNSCPDPTKVVNQKIKE